MLKSCGVVIPEAIAAPDLDLLEYLIDSARNANLVAVLQSDSEANTVTVAFTRLIQAGRTAGNAERGNTQATAAGPILNILGRESKII